MRELTANELNAYLEGRLVKDSKGAPLLLDVREPWEFSLCSIEGSQNIPMGQVPGAAARLDSQRETIVVCHHGVRSRQVGAFLEQRGFSGIVNLSNGIDGWAREVDPSMQTY